MFYDLPLKIINRKINYVTLAWRNDFLLITKYKLSLIIFYQRSHVGLENILSSSLQTGKTPPPNNCFGYDTKPSDSEALHLELWWMWITNLLLLLSGPLWTWMKVPVRFPSMDQKRLSNYFLVVVISNK